MEIRCAASFKTTAAQKISDPSCAQARGPTPCTVREVLHRRTTAASPSSPRGWPCQMLGSWRCKSLQAERSLAPYQLRHSLWIPRPSLHPSQAFVMLPTQRMSPHSARSELAEALCSTEIITSWGWKGALRGCLVQALPPGRTMSQTSSWNLVLPDFSDFQGLRQGRSIFRSH